MRAFVFGSLAIWCLVESATAAVASDVSPDRDFSEWRAGSGSWTSATRWTDGVPTAFQSAVVRGDGEVEVPAGVFVVGDLKIGFNRGDRARVVVQGGELVLMQDSLRIGEYTGGEAEFVLRQGAMHCAMDVFVGAASTVPGRATRATLRISGGSFVGRTLTVGAGIGAESLLAIEGSQASAVHVLDYFYLEGIPAGQTESGSTLSFTLDAQGVTPITVQSRRDGFRIIRRENGRCRLRVALSAVPPGGDITLVSTHVPIQGEFDDLPEGSEITANFHDRTYRWRITYRGGLEGHDLTLKGQGHDLPDTPVAAVRSPPSPLWNAHRILPLAMPRVGVEAFPGAEGYGAGAAGGRGGRVIYVDTLADAGPGSLRAAIETKGPRRVVFRVGGVIALRSMLVVSDPFLTLDGSAAPGSGIMLRNHGVQVQTHDVILRHFRVRIGDDEVRTGAQPLSYYQGGEGDYALYFTGASNCIADHLSLSWSTSKTVSVTKMSDAITIQWCVISESLNFADHGYASIAGGNRTTWHHNLFAHHLSRSVRFQGMVDADFRNNVIYDWGHTAGYGEFDRLNYVGNTLVPGPSTTQARPFFHTGAEVVGDGSLFVADNAIRGDARATQDNWRGMGYYYFERERIAAREPFPAAPVTTEQANTAFVQVLAEAGATLPRRDVVDARVVNEVRTGGGRIVKSVAEARGWPEFPTATK